MIIVIFGTIAKLLILYWDHYFVAWQDRGTTFTHVNNHATSRSLLLLLSVEVISFITSI